MVGCARGDVGSAVVGALQAAVGHIQEVAIGGNVARRERLLPLEHLQPLLHLPLELLVLQLLLLVNALRWQPRFSRFHLGYIVGKFKKEAVRRLHRDTAGLTFG